MKGLFLAPFMRWLSRLSHPKLFMVVGGLFLVDLAIPNFIPWDDLLLGIATFALANWKKKRDGAATPGDTIEGTSTRR